ncbi:hypothetical protein [Nocardioides antri]|uniref:Nuclear transport factor 2 family protein n=1 Tax=Nocardioides antri TaxID=2607659 RepID=A0A5B1MA85_9ACTN|nr:hypothetical protein [Nocardioides antri]KAA1428837.1 hypothetical protein F0U47_01045 [Nocardioides antri]
MPTSVAAVVLALVLGVTGCSGGDDDEPDGDGKGDGSSTSTGIPSRVEVGEVAGKLGRKPARGVARDVAAVVDRWIDAAYVGGDYPRSDFSGAFSGFTGDAARLATRQAGLMSNKAVGGKVDGVTATRRVVSVDVLAPQGRPAGATAHVNLVMEITGDVERTEQVQGRLMLVRAKKGWRIFGFDIARGEVRK